MRKRLLFVVPVAMAAPSVNAATAFAGAAPPPNRHGGGFLVVQADRAGSKQTPDACQDNDWQQLPNHDPANVEAGPGLPHPAYGEWDASARTCPERAARS